MSKVKKMFAGGNSSLGFYSFYHNIIGEQANRVWLLKGGPGTGKSTFMRKIACLMLARGYDIEEFRCSSDAHSLDGIVVPALKVALIDGTAPHVVDPKFPGCIDEIIHLGDFWRLEQLEEQKEYIIRLTKENSACYRRAYRYLRAAKAMYEDIEEINSRSTDFGKANQIAANLLNDIFREHRVVTTPGTVRDLFASAITPQGPVNFLPSIVEGYAKTIILKGEPGTGKSAILEKVVASAVQRGFYVEAFHCPLDPTKIEHLVIPELDVAMVTSYEPHEYENEHATTVNLNECLDVDTHREYYDILHKNRDQYADLMERVYEELRKAKAIHDELEAPYITVMDWDKVNVLRQEITERILGYQKK